MAKHVVGGWMWWLDTYRANNPDNPDTPTDLKLLFQRYIKGFPPD